MIIFALIQINIPGIGVLPYKGLVGTCDLTEDLGLKKDFVFFTFSKTGYLFLVKINVLNRVRFWV